MIFSLVGDSFANESLMIQEIEAHPKKVEVRALLRELSSNDIEKKIKIFNDLISILVKNREPYLFGAVQNDLAIALSGRIKGDRAQNLEDSIKHYKSALEVRTKESFPIDWAGIQNNLAIALSDRIKGDRAQNLENSIKHCNVALEVHTKESFPTKWAMTQNNLAVAFNKRIKGDRTQNIEDSIKHYKATLKVYTKESFPIDWVGTQNNLALAFMEIEKYKEAIEVYEEFLKENHKIVAYGVIMPSYRKKLIKDSSDDLVNLALAYTKVGQFDKAFFAL